MDLLKFMTEEGSSKHIVVVTTAITKKENSKMVLIFLIAYQLNITIFVVPEEGRGRFNCPFFLVVIGPEAHMQALLWILIVTHLQRLMWQKKFQNCLYIGKKLI